MPILSFFYFAIWFGGAFWSVSGRFLDAETAPKVYWALFGAALFSLGCVATAFSGRGEAKKPHFIGISAAIVLCAVSQAVYALLQWSGACPSAGPFPACGSFDNPAGLASALAFSLPFGLHLAENCQRPLRSALCVAMALTACAILASGSRSGMLAMGAVLPAYLLTKRRRTRSALFLTLLAAAAAVAAAGLYHYKKDSADGRLLIWQCTWELIKESPWTGHGPGGFQAHYMEAQADYFRQHPDSPYARLADDVKAPLQRIPRAMDRLRPRRSPRGGGRHRPAPPCLAQTLLRQFTPCRTLPAVRGRLLNVFLSFPLSTHMDVHRIVCCSAAPQCLPSRQPVAAGHSRSCRLRSLPLVGLCPAPDAGGNTMVRCGQPLALRTDGTNVAHLRKALYGNEGRAPFPL